MARTTIRGPVQGRVLGLYALATMEREGPIYGYALGERISAATDGAWRPGAGAVYPALNALVARGAARASRDGRRRIYAITPQGRTLLRRIREYFARGDGDAPDLSRLWATIHGSDDVGAHLLRHLHRHLDSLVASVERAPRGTQRALREQAVAELTGALQRLRPRPARPARGGVRAR